MSCTPPRNRTEITIVGKPAGRARGRFCKLSGEHFLDEGEHRAEEGKGGNPQAQIGRQPQRRGGKREQTVQGQLEGFCEGVLRYAGGARGAVELHGGLPEAAPGPQPAQVAVAFRQRINHVHHLFSSRQKSPASRGIGNGVIFAAAGKNPRPADFLAAVLAFLADGKDHVISFAPFGQQPGRSPRADPADRRQ